MKEKPYTYRDFITGKVRRTHGEWVGWSKPTGPLNVRYATFKTPRTFVNVPAYCLTPETKERIPPQPTGHAQEV